MKILLLLFFASVGWSQTTSSDWYGPLEPYEGTWSVKWNNAGKPNILVNECAVLNKFFACGQTVNGNSGGLIVFLPAGKPGLFRTQTIMPDGRASGLSDVTIQGNTWTYTNRRDQGGRTTFYKTTNVFTDKDHIHFEMAESDNGTQWTVKNSGDEERVKATRSDRR